MANLNTANVSTAAQKKAKAEAAEAAKEAGENIVEEDGVTYRVEEAFGTTIKTRID